MSGRDYKIPNGPTVTINIPGLVPPDPEWLAAARARMRRQCTPRVEVTRGDLGRFGRDDVAFSVRATFDAATVALFNHDQQKEPETMPKHQEMTEHLPKDPYPPPAGYVWWEGKVGDIVPLDAKWGVNGEITPSYCYPGRVPPGEGWTHATREGGSKCSGIVVPVKSGPSFLAEVIAAIQAAPKPERSFRDPVIAAAWGVNVEPQPKPLESFSLTVTLGKTPWVGQCDERLDGRWDVRANRDQNSVGRHLLMCDRPDRYSLVRELQACAHNGAVIESGDMTDGIRPDPVTDRDTLTIYGPDESEAP